MRSLSLALFIAAIMVSSAFLGAGTYAYTTGGTFTIRAPEEIKPLV